MVRNKRQIDPWSTATPKLPEDAMDVNATPFFDASVNTTGCCPSFNPEGWDGATVTFEGKPFVRATTWAIAHFPINMGKVFAHVLKHLDDAGAVESAQTLVLSRDISAFEGEHLFAVAKPVQSEEMTSLSGRFLTKVFEGPYSETPRWEKELLAQAESKGSTPGRVWFFYTTCPKCAKAYGKNPVVGFVELLT
jgi:hypothetical protein